MLVKELIDILNTMPKDATAIIDHSEMHEWHSIEDVYVDTFAFGSKKKRKWVVIGQKVYVPTE